MAARQPRTIALALLFASAAGCSLAFETSDIDQGCGAGMKWCKDGCVSLTDPAWGCSNTDCKSCGAPNAIAGCDDHGQCTILGCVEGFANCGFAKCDTNTLTSGQHCGGCGMACEPGKSCIAGHCGDPTP